LIEHPFIAANFGGSGDDLCLSYIENQEKNHKKMMENPHKWINENKDKVTELNSRKTENFDKLYLERLNKFQDMLELNN
jgi:hypothetical protein